MSLAILTIAIMAHNGSVVLQHLLQILNTLGAIYNESVYGNTLG